ncbi:MAG: DUF6677 family protein [Vicinamibacterales bacterium]
MPPTASVTPARVAAVCLAGWAVPGAGHLLQGRTAKGLIFLLALSLMFATGLWLEGQIFAFDLAQPLVFLEAVADLGIGLPFLAVRAAGLGTGRVVAVTYEYGNTFILVAGLLNLLVVLDAYDIAHGRK